MSNFKQSMMSVPSLTQVSGEQNEEIKQFLTKVREEVVPEIVKDVEMRYKNAEVARALFLS
ncbi:hypothetical protein [Burkholderia ubonensis]|uniref:hypothetical protein n=1 Tax=Burkholderia ubonensis TaxID=101571 RepID=UPI000AB05E23|nr:hypothetical protein [Burkholderia ubonensis]